MSEAQRSEASASTDLLYVLAGTYEQARKFAYSKGVQYTRMVSVDRREKIMGLRGKKLYVVGTAYERDDYDALLIEAGIREFDVEHV